MPHYREGDKHERMGVENSEGTIQDWEVRWPLSHRAATEDTGAGRPHRVPARSEQSDGKQSW